MMVSTLPDLHLKHMGVNLKVVEGLMSPGPCIQLASINLEGGGMRNGAALEKGL